jgi:hypothetical protein
VTDRAFHKVLGKENMDNYIIWKWRLFN